MPSSPPSNPSSVDWRGAPLGCAERPARSPAYADVAVPVPLDGAFTYSVPEGLAAEHALQPGMRVTAPWGARQLTGVITALRESCPPNLPPERIRALSGVLDDAPVVDAAVLELVRWTASYYQAPLGEVMRCALPPGPVRAPRRRRNAVETAAPAWTARPRILELNAAQQAALAAIEAFEAIGAPGRARPLLLHGVTGSGKTAVYLAAMEAALARGESVLLLVPEIGLTPALFADFEAAFPALVAVLHSGLAPGERAAHWQRLRTGEARVAVGTRSAVFAPLQKLGLIVVDEEHDASYKQQEAPRYHGRDLAVLRAKLCGSRIVLGSATPSLESYAHARSGKYRLATMAERATPRPLPTVRLVDMGAEFQTQAAGKRGRREPVEDLLSAELRVALEERLRRGQQSLLLINRRGFAPVVMCRACGTTVMCRDCALALTYHKRAGRLLCHLCGYSIEPPRACPSCGSEHIYFLGSGSEKVEEALTALWPAARIARLDRDTARSRRHFEQTLAAFRDGALDILVGTQMIAKGHDLPGVTLVGVLHADLGLSFPDFRAAERTFQLLTQVAGRAGRGDEAGEVVFQVIHPSHYAVAAAARASYEAFYDKEANFRRWMHYPPFAALASAQLRHRDYDRVLAYATQAGQFLRERAAAYPDTRVLGPAPALLARAKSLYRFQFLFKSESRRSLHALLGELRAFAREAKFPATALSLDVDPLSL